MKVIAPLAFAAFLAATPSLASAQADVLPIDYFTKHEEFGGIKLSPTGEHAAFLTGEYGRSVLAFVSIKDRKTTYTPTTGGGFQIYDFDWISASRVIYRLGEWEYGTSRHAKIGELYAAEIGKRPDYIYGYRDSEQQTGSYLKGREASFAWPEIISPHLAEDNTVSIAEYPLQRESNVKPQIVRLSTSSGRTRLQEVISLYNAQVIADHNHEPRFATGLDKEYKLAVAWKPENQKKWTEFALPGFHKETVVPQMVSEDGQSLYFSGARENALRQGLYSVNVTTREIKTVHEFEDSDVDGLVRDFSQKKLIGVRSSADKPTVHWLDANDKVAKINGALSRAFPGQTVTITSASQDGRLATVFVSSDVKPGEYYMFDTQSMKVDPLQPSRRWIDPKRMRPMEPFRMKARDGLELYGYITKPKGEGPYPLVVLPHGGPHGTRNTWSFDWEVQLLANRGYAVLQVNYRGSSGYGYDFETRGYRQWGASMQDDITDATRWAIEQKIARADRICIYGTSFGGYAALQGAIREPALYRCAIGNAGIYDLELLQKSAEAPDSGGSPEYLIRVLGKDRNEIGARSPVYHADKTRDYLIKVLGNDREDLRARSPAYHADKIQVPVLLIHSKEEWRDDFSQAKRMKASLEGNKKPFEWMALSQEGNGVFKEETRREVYERILKFLEKNLPVG